MKSKHIIFFVVILTAFCLLAGCSKTNIDYNEIEWLDGIVFSNLSPGKEAMSDGEISINSNKEVFIYAITWGDQDLTLEFGLLSADGTEYSVEYTGGSAQGTIDNLPVGTYQVFVRNSGDYSGLPSFDNPEEYNVSFDATGCINYTISK